MSLVQQPRNAISAHPRVTSAAAEFGIGLAITFVRRSVVGVFDHSHAAFAHGCNGCGGNGGNYP